MSNKTRNKKLQLNVVKQLISSIKGNRNSPLSSESNVAFDSTISEPPPNLNDQPLSIPSAILNMYDGFEVIPGEIVNPNNFYLLKIEHEDEDVEQSHEMLEYRMDKYYDNKPGLQITFEEVPKFCVAQTPDNSCWARVEIQNHNELLYKCLYIDYGFNGYLEKDELFWLDEQFMKIPKRAFRATLHGVGDNSDQTWSIKNINKFKALMTENADQMTAYIVDNSDSELTEVILITKTSCINMEMMMILDDDKPNLD